VLLLSTLLHFTPAGAIDAAIVIDAARAECRQGAPENGLERLRAANLLRAENETPADSPEAWLTAAECEVALGRVAEARAILEGGLAFFTEQGNSPFVHQFAWSLGRLHTESGSLQMARDYLQLALEHMATDAGGHRRFELLMELGAARAGVDEFDAATAAFEDALTLADRDGLVTEMIASRLALARVDIETGGRGPARRAQARLDEVLELMDDHGGGIPATQQLQLGELYHRVDQKTGETHNTRSALELLDAAAKQAQREQDLRTESFALGYLGAIAERFGENEKALTYSRLAVARAEAADAPDGLYQWQWQTARLLDRMEQPERSAAAYQQSIDTLERIRPELSRGSSSDFQKAVAPVFFGMADLLLRQPAATAKGASEDASLRLVRQTIEELKRAEIQDYFDDDCVIGEQHAAPLDQLATDAAVIYPIIFDDRLEILISVGGTIRRHTTKVDRSTLTDTVRAFRLNLERRPTNRYREPGRRLYEWMIGPVLDELRDGHVSTLIFVPDGPLRSVPPAAFYDGNRFLIEEFAVSTTLSLTLASPRPIQLDSARVLAGGLTVSREGFSALPGVGTELQEVARIFNSTALRDDTFRVNPVVGEMEAGGYSIVHIATHGQFDRDFRKSFLLAYDGRITMDLLEHTVSRRRFNTQPVELLVLSACETAAGDDRAALGLAGVALKAGARSAVATLWSVYDEATAELVRLFYENLRAGRLSKAQALRQAQLRMLDDQRYAHPAVWSAFLLIGNWL